MISSFRLSEEFFLGGKYVWRLKESQIRFRGSGEFAQLVDQRITASEKQVAAFEDALELLDIWSWRNDYESKDVGCITDDGSVWTFSASINGAEVNCGGANAYPAFRDAKITTVDRGRFAMLTAAMYACFDIERYIHIAQHHRRSSTHDDE